MTLFHVSTQKYKEEEIISSADFELTFYYRKAIEKRQNWIDDLLDSKKPMTVPSRKNSLFAFDKIENCLAFVLNRPDKLYYYKVEMENPIGYPMCLTDRLRRDDNCLNDRILCEYWNPVEKWKFLEYIGHSMTVVKVESQPQNRQAGLGIINYNHDLDIAKKLFKL
jgi:hypothetical protein